MRKLSLLLGVLMLCAQVFAQPRTITGKITDANGNPIPNASIVIKNTTTGTVSKEDGSFSFSVPPSARVLVISSVSKESQEISIVNKTSFIAVLAPDNKGLEEVIVTGYGSKKKTDLTASISKVGGDKLEKCAYGFCG